MTIKASTAAEVGALVAALLGPDDVMRESAIARLAIIGPRATERVIASYGATTDGETKIALLRAMEAIGDPRAAPLARQALRDGGRVGLAAAGVLRVLLDSSHIATATAALDALVTAALDRGMERPVRLAAFEALQDVPGDVGERVAAALREDGDAVLQTGAAEAPRAAAAAAALWTEALAGRLPDAPAAFGEALQTRAASAPLAVLQTLIDAMRAREAAVRSASLRSEWRALRGRLHHALALRGSRVALYDLRETLAEAAEPLPVSYLAALHVVGDASCLEPIVAAFSRAQPGEAWWRHQLAAAFQGIVKRERITQRHPIRKRIRNRWPEAAGQIGSQ